jgi:hypothetical protein
MGLHSGRNQELVEQFRRTMRRKVPIAQHVDVKRVESLFDRRAGGLPRGALYSIDQGAAMRFKKWWLERQNWFAGGGWVAREKTVSLG